jgi:hypothetical protein
MKSDFFYFVLLLKRNKLYAFIHAINQNNVHFIKIYMIGPGYAVLGTVTITIKLGYLTGRDMTKHYQW